jgi:type VI secretion system secreted protein Hcp
MAADYFLKLDGIDGESTDKGHPNWIDIESFSWGVSQSGSTSGGTGGGTGKAVPADVSVVMPFCKASPSLFVKCATGAHIATATLACRKTGESQQDFLKINLTEILISSYEVGGAEDTPFDKLSLNFAKIEFDYHLTNPDGSFGDEIKTSYDFLRQVAA